jgi:hypothetical protein
MKTNVQARYDKIKTVFLPKEDKVSLLNKNRLDRYVRVNGTVTIRIKKTNIITMQLKMAANGSGLADVPAISIPSA